MQVAILALANAGSTILIMLTDTWARPVRPPPKLPSAR